MQRLLLSILLGFATAFGTYPVFSQSTGFLPLFNGKDLDGWTTKGNFETEIKEGAVYLKASHAFNNAWLLTEKHYRNFILEWEFQTEEGVNSGVLFRYNPAVDGALNVLAYEANIDWNPNIQEPLGTIEHVARAKVLDSLDKAAWNQMRVEAVGDHFKSYINGTLVCEGYNRRSQVGVIGLQAPLQKGGVIGFRNIRIQELPNSEVSIPLIEEYYRAAWVSSLESMFTEGSLEGWHSTGPGTWEWEEGGVLHGYSGETPSFLISDKAYQNFYLSCKFKIQKEDNSGIFIRKHPDSSTVSLDNSIECNIYDHNGPGHAFSTGSIVTHARAWAGMIDYEDWNTMEIFAHESLIVLYINGRKSAEAHLPEAFNQAGNICLQAGTRIFSDNGPSHIYFKDVRIRNMDGK